ncbi:MAG: hypothetical protein QM662_11630 [Gordonia sp. (in: high G+C Gram-positive bacteria)]
MHSALGQSPVLAVIVACEIGFWALLLVGLGVRYLVHRPRASVGILALIPLLDLILLGAVAVDLHGGAPVTTVHRLAGIYLGVTVAFGHSLVGWADRRFAYWFADGERPPKPPTAGPAALRHELIGFGHWLLAAAVGAGAVGLLSITVADDQQRHDLVGIFPMLGVVTVIWLLTGPVWVLLTPRKGT